MGQGDLTCPPPAIQKLADRSDVICEVPECSKIRREAYSAPPEPLADGEELAAPSQEQHPHSRLFGPRFYGSQGLTHYSVGNLTNDIFQM